MNVGEAQNIHLAAFVVTAVVTTITSLASVKILCRFAAVPATGRTKSLACTQARPIEQLGSDPLMIVL